MNESTIDRDEQILSDELPDVALEVCGGKIRGSWKPLYDCILLRIGHLSRIKAAGVDQQEIGPHFHIRAGPLTSLTWINVAIAISC